MKKILKIVGFILAGIVVIITGFAVTIQLKGIPSFESQVVEMTVDVTPERVANGQRYATLLCVQCHTGESGKLTGKRLADVPKEFGEIYSMNITKDREKGIGAWTDGQLYYFLRTGIRSDGSFAPLYMPKFPLAGDEDLKDIIAWLRSDNPMLEASKEEAPPSKPSFITKLLVNTVMGPLPYPSQPMARPDSADRIALGSYLTNNLVGCFACHSRDFKTNNDLDPPKSEGYLGGGNPMPDFDGNIITTSNITFDETGLSGWSEEDFIKAVKYCKRPDGSLMRYPMTPQITLTDYEVGSIYAFLQTVPKIQNKIAR